MILKEFSNDFDMESFEELQEKINASFSRKELEEDIGLFHEMIWPSVILCEEYFRKSNDIRALEFEVELLCQMGDNRFQGQFLSDAYVICKRILDISPNKEEVKHTIKNHIIPYFKKDLSYWEEISKKDKSAKEMLEYYKKNNESIESKLDEYFTKCKNDKFELFVDTSANNFSQN